MSNAKIHQEPTTTFQQKVAGAGSEVPSLPGEEEARLLHRKPKPLDELQLRELMMQGFTKGLSMSLNPMRDLFALRYWIVDNSGSMTARDGHRIVPVKSPQFGNSVRLEPCSRWEEIVDCVECHIKLSALVDAPTRFRLLNSPDGTSATKQFSVAESLHPQESEDDVRNAVQIIRSAKPQGVTPLTRHIQEIYEEVSRMAPKLNQLGRKVVIVIATDGLPSDNRGYSTHSEKARFVNALRLLEGLPVWVVVRLCTDEESVVDYWNDLDGQLELSLEVLDDFSGEALEVTGENPWLNYTLAIHRLREMGFHDRVFDMLDERPLTKTEIRDYFALLFGEENFDGVPDPSLDWKGFIQDIESMLDREAVQWDPVKKCMNPLVNIKKLNKTHKKRRGILRLFLAAR